MADRIRLTITVTPEVHEVFSRMSEASGLSLGRCMGDWLADTAEGAQFVLAKMEQARSAPKMALRELHAMTHGLQGEIQGVLDGLRRPPASGGTPLAGGAARVRLPSPPSSNTGGKVPRRRAK